MVIDPVYEIPIAPLFTVSEVDTHSGLWVIPVDGWSATTWLSRTSKTRGPSKGAANHAVGLQTNWTCVHIPICLCAHIYIYIDVHIYVYVYIYISLCACVKMLQAPEINHPSFKPQYLRPMLPPKNGRKGSDIHSVDLNITNVHK